LGGQIISAREGGGKLANVTELSQFSSLHPGWGVAQTAPSPGDSFVITKNLSPRSQGVFAALFAAMLTS
jgi:hypothetical protein